MTKPRHLYLLLLIGLLLPFIGAAQIEDEIRRTTTIEKNPVSVVRERIVLAIMAGDVLKARSLTDSLHASARNSQIKPFSLAEQFVLNRIMGRSDSAVKAYYDRNILAEQSSPRSYSFERNDYLDRNYQLLYEKQKADTSYLNDSSLTRESKDFIRFFEQEGKRIYAFRKDKKISITVLVQELNVNSRLFLERYPNSRFTEYMKENTEAKCFTQLKGYNLLFDVSLWLPMGTVQSKLAPGFTFQMGFQAVSPRYKLGMGVKISQSKLNKAMIHESDTIAKGKSLSMISFLLQNEFLLKGGRTNRHWFQVNSEIGNSRFILEKATDKKSAVTFGIGPVVDFSVGYHFQNLNIDQDELSSPLNERIILVNFGLLVKAGYFSTLANWSIRGSYLSAGITFGMLNTKRKNIPDPEQVEMNRW